MGMLTDEETVAQKMAFIKKESIYNQFYSDLVTEIDDGISIHGAEVHIFYAKKMGKKYLTRYNQHFKNPDIRTQDMQHEQMFFCHHDLWLHEVLSCCGIEWITPVRRD